MLLNALSLISTVDLSIQVEKRFVISRMQHQLPHSKNPNLRIVIKSRSVDVFSPHMLLKLPGDKNTTSFRLESSDKYLLLFIAFIALCQTNLENQNTKMARWSHDTHNDYLPAHEPE